MFLLSFEDRILIKKATEPERLGHKERRRVLTRHVIRYAQSGPDSAIIPHHSAMERVTRYMNSQFRARKTSYLHPGPSSRPFIVPVRTKGEHTNPAQYARSVPLGQLLRRFASEVVLSLPTHPLSILTSIRQARLRYVFAPKSTSS